MLQNIEYFQEFQVLHQAANDLPKQPNLGQVYQTAAAAALEALNCRHATIFILERPAGELTAQARAGKPSEAPEVKHFKWGEGLAGEVAKTGHSIAVRDTASDPRFVESVKPRSAPRSIILAPIKVEEEVLGVISADKDEIDGFTPHNLEILETLALDVGLAINLRRQQDRLQTLNEVGQTLTSGIRLQQDGVLRLIYEQAQKLTQTQNIYIALYEKETNTVHFKLVMEKGQQVDPQHHDRLASRQIKKTKRGKTEEVILTGKPMLHRTRAEEVAWYRQKGHREYVGEMSASHLAVPMILNQKVKGVIAIYDWEQEHAYDEQDIQVLSAMASQAAIALDNAALFNSLTEANQALERRVEALTALNEVGRTLTSGLRLTQDEILELIYQQARQLTGTQDMYIALYDETTQMIEFKLALEKGERAEIAAPRRADMGRRGKTEEVIFTKRPILHKTEQESEAWYKLPEHQEFIGRVPPTWLGVPMMIAEKVLGMIAIYDWEQEHAYDELHQQILSSMASQAAIALDNANLYYEVNQALANANQALERRVEALTALNEVGRTLTSGLRLTQDEILELIYQQARQLTGTQDMYIALYDETTQMIEFKLALEKGERAEIAAPRRADMGRRGKTEEVIFTKRPILHKTEQESEAWYKLPEHQEFTGSNLPSSWLGVPMMIAEKVLGMIAIYDWEQEHATMNYTSKFSPRWPARPPLHWIIQNFTSV
ncbi:MAG: GAF domain-containing protein [Anaerolineae bacterium]